MQPHIRLSIILQTYKVVSVISAHRLDKNISNKALIILDALYVI